MRNYKEIYMPKQNEEYWCVIDEDTIHYFKKEIHAIDYASRHNIEDINIFKECFN